MAILVLFVTIIGFIIIQLPPGDFLTTYMMQLIASGEEIDEAKIENLRQRYGLDLPMYQQYLKWLKNMAAGNFGMSFDWNRPVIELIKERIVLTTVISLVTLVLTYLIAIPIGIYSATHQYSIGDYFFTIVGFTGLAVPNFLFALILLFLIFQYFGVNVCGLFSPDFLRASWSFAKIIDLLKHMPIPLIVVGTAGTAGIIRIMRASMLDELRKQYVITAKAKGVHHTRLLIKYPVRVSVNPIVSTVGWMLPQIVSGATITAIVLNLPTVGPLLLRALMCQDMYLAGSIIVLLTILSLLGTLISDVLLMMVDPRIRFERGQ